MLLKRRMGIKMNKEKYIKEIIGEAVREYGFEKFTHFIETGWESYEFERVDGELKQNILITIMDSDLRLEFRTNAYGQFAVDATDLFPSNLASDRPSFLMFKNEEEFKKIIYLSRDIILQNGFTILEKLSKPTTEVHPRKETYWKVYTENKKLEEKYRKMYELEDTEFTRKMMQKISDIILSTKDKEFAEVEDMLVGLAAVYGNQIIRKCGGQWKKYKDSEVCLIGSVFGRSSENPLSNIIHYWDRKEENISFLLGPFKKHPYDTVI